MAAAARPSDDRYAGRGGVFESIDEGGSGPARSVEGWMLFVTGVHEEASEDDVLDTFADIGDVKNVTLNLDRKTGFAKGYALVEFSQKAEAEQAIQELDGSKLLGQTIHVDWAFVQDERKGRR